MRPPVWMLLLAPLGGCGPSLDVGAELKDGRVVFDIPRRGVNGLLGIEVRDERGDVLWSRSFNYEKGRRIPYGGAADLRGRTVTVTVDYQYDRLAACSGTFSKTLSIP